MGSRLLAFLLLLASALVAWLAVTLTPIGRLVQLAVILSIVYVGYLAFHGYRVVRAALQRAASGAGIPTGRADGLPWVSLVIPARDEAPVIGDLLADLAALNYHARGAPHYDVLVVDDRSTDGTAEIVRAAGVPLLVRPPEAGPHTKGTALAVAEPLRGDIVGVLDADSRVEPDLLERVMNAWRTDAAAAAIQVQRRPYNADVSWLTGGQADEQLMDLASQCGRWATDGTAELRGNGMFVRREVLERVGGWERTALTEDLELSTRLAAAGEHVAIAPAAVIGEEAVVTLRALWRQRLRWAEGSLRRLMEHAPRLLLGSLPLGRKLDFLAFVGEFVIPPVFVGAFLAALVATPSGRADWSIPVSLFVAYGFGTFLLGLAGLAAVGVRGGELLQRSARGALFLSHWLLVIPAALALIAVGRRQIDFVKTPRAPRDAAGTRRGLDR
jgi:1,2-diacylglycerol 3-beta-glucosyltransferase